jgi:hypothetical protein
MPPERDRFRASSGISGHDTGVIGHDAGMASNSAPHFATERARCQLFDWNQRAAPRINMRKIKAVLRLKLDAKLSHQQIAGVRHQPGQPGDLAGQPLGVCAAEIDVIRIGRVNVVTR